MLVLGRHTGARVATRRQGRMADSVVMLRRLIMMRHMTRLAGIQERRTASTADKVLERQPMLGGLLLLV